MLKRGIANVVEEPLMRKIRLVFRRKGRNIPIVRFASIAARSWDQRDIPCQTRDIVAWLIVVAPVTLKKGNMRKRARKIYYRTCGLTDSGKVRQNNEDTFLINKDLNFFVVADGMGGLKSGEVASRMATVFSEKFVQSLLPNRKEEDTFTEDSFPPSDEEAMRKVVEKTNRALFKENAGKDKKMGTTFVCAKILADKIYITNSGDSRCYQIRNGKMVRLTVDQSPVEELIQSGRAKGKEPELKKMMRYVRGALGLDEDVDPDIIASIPQKGDIYLLCTDGLTKMMNDEKIENIVQSERNIKKSCQLLVNVANELGGRDNITVLMVEVTGVELEGSKKDLKTPKTLEQKEETLID